MADSTQPQNSSICNQTAQIELAWAAGFFDGEGNCRCSLQKVELKRNKSRAYGTFVMQIAQLDRGVLDRFCAAVGFGKVNGPYFRKSLAQSTKPYFTFHSSGRDGVKAYYAIRPHLSQIKRDQAELAILRYDELINRPRLGNGHLRKKELEALAAST